MTARVSAAVVREALHSSGGNVSRTAREIGISRRTVQRHAKRNPTIAASSNGLFPWTDRPDGKKAVLVPKTFYAAIRRVRAQLELAHGGDHGALSLLESEILGACVVDCLEAWAKSKGAK